MGWGANSVRVPPPMADDEKPPRVLIAGADDPLAEALTASFIAAGRVVRLTHEEPLDWVDEGGPHIQFFESRLQDEVATDVLVRDMAAAVLLPRRGTQHDWLDYDTRMCSNLLKALSEQNEITSGQMKVIAEAGDAACTHVVVVSTLALARAGEAGPWEPPRTSDDPGSLGPHAVEYRARHFAEASGLRVTILRFSEEVWAGERDAAATAVEAITAAALGAPLPPTVSCPATAGSCSVVHVQTPAQHPQPPSNDPALPPNELLRPELEKQFTAPNRSLGVEWLRPGTGVEGLEPRL